MSTISPVANTGPSTSSVTTPARILVKHKVNLKGSRFVGITGITDPADAQTCIQSFMDHISTRPALAGTSLVLGFLTTQAKLEGGQHKSTRSLTATGINDVCITQHNQVQYTVHLCARSADGISASLRIIRDSCPRVHGVQFNIPFLQARDLRREVGAVYGDTATPRIPLFLSIEPETLRECEWDPDAVTAHIDTFIYGEGGRIDPCVDRIIIDPSEGNGLVMDPEKILPILRAINKQFPGLPLICSGGLSGKTVTAIMGNIADEIPYISTDAEGALRTDQDHFDCNAAAGYIQSTLQLFEDVSCT